MQAPSLFTKEVKGAVAVAVHGPAPLATASNSFCFDDSHEHISEIAAATPNTASAMLPSFLDETFSMGGGSALGVQGAAPSAAAVPTTAVLRPAGQEGQICPSATAEGADCVVEEVVEEPDPHHHTHRQSEDDHEGTEYLINGE
jgi:hypothetical protein